MFQYFRIICLLICLEILSEKDTIIFAACKHLFLSVQIKCYCYQLCDHSTGFFGKGIALCLESKCKGIMSINWLPNNQQYPGVRPRTVLLYVSWIFKETWFVYNQGFTETLISWYCQEDKPRTRHTLCIYINEMPPRLSTWDLQPLHNNFFAY